MVYERIYHEAGAQHRDAHAVFRAGAADRGAGKRPVERDSLYQPVRETFDDLPPEPRCGRGAASGGARRMKLGPDSLDQLLPGLWRDRPGAGARARRAGERDRRPSSTICWPRASWTSSVVSAVEYARNAAAYHLLPDLAITCDGPVHSVKLFSRRPVAELDGPHHAADRIVAGHRCCCWSCSAATAGASRPGSPRCGPKRRDLESLGGLAARSGAGHRRRGAACWRRGAYTRCEVDLGERVEGLDRAALRLRRLGRAARRRARRRFK